MASKPPQGSKTPNTVVTSLEYSRRFLIYGFAISLALHFIFGPLVQWKRPPDAGEKVEKVSLTKKITKVATPKPTPTPPPSPTPKPVTQTPPPNTPPPKQVQLKVQPPKTTSNAENAPSEAQYNVKQGSQQGVPQGVPSAAGTAAPVAAPTPTPSPTPTRPACANPNLDAVATDKVVPDMPDIARQMGATGTAQIKVSLDANGRVTDVSVFKSTSNRALDNAALTAAKQSRYRAEVKNCVATAGSYLYTVTFENQ